VIYFSAAFLAVFSALAAHAWLMHRERRFWTTQLATQAELHGRERTEHRKEVVDLVHTYREELAQLNQTRMEETANLLQRIQAPEQAVASHVAETAPPDPPPVDLEDDEEMFRVREERLRALGMVTDG
jgi:hypothetical protein